MSIGQVIKVVREERGLTQSQFAHELFVTQQALSRWEKGTAEPSIDMIRLISTRFEVPMARLMEMPDNGFCQSCAMPFYRPEEVRHSCLRTVEPAEVVDQMALS